MSSVILINPKVPIDPYFAQKELFPSGALLLLGTILKKSNHKVEVIHEAADGLSRKDLIDKIALELPDIVGITVTTFNCKSARDLCRQIREKFPWVKVAVGGPHTSALGREGIKYPPEADIWVVGEGDNIIKDIADGKIKEGIHFPEMLPNLDNVPSLDLSFTNIKNFSGTYPPGRLPGMFVMGSRGCPFNCTFCSRAVFGKTSRQRQPEAAVEEAERLITDFGIREVFFHDDTFNIRHEWSYDLLGLLRKRGLHKRATFRTPCRVNEKLVTEELLREMKATNFWLIFFGVESGSDTMLESMKKGITTDEIKRAFNLCHKVGIKPEASFIIGMPGETYSTIKASEGLWERIKPYWSSFSRAIPFPGTELYKSVKDSGDLLETNFENFGVNRMLVRTYLMTGEELEVEAQRLDRLMMKQKVSNLLMGHPERLVRIIKDAGGFGKVIVRLKRLVV